MPSIFLHLAPRINWCGRCFKYCYQSTNLLCKVRSAWRINVFAHTFKKIEILYGYLNIGVCVPKQCVNKDNMPKNWMKIQPLSIFGSFPLKTMQSCTWWQCVLWMKFAEAVTCWEKRVALRVLLSPEFILLHFITSMHMIRNVSDQEVLHFLCVWNHESALKF